MMIDDKNENVTNQVWESGMDCDFEEPNACLWSIVPHSVKKQVFELFTYLELEVSIYQLIGSLLRRSQ